jgi:arylsulfate sulfotransferase
MTAEKKIPAFTSSPSISGNPNPRVPLAAILSFTADKKVQTTVEVSDGEREWEINFDDSHRLQDGLPLLGMRPDRRHRFQISIRDTEGNTTRAPETLEFKTPPLPPGPREWPPIRVNVSKPDQMEPGITLVSVRRRAAGREILMSKAQRAFNRDWSLIVALDTEGEVIWYYLLAARLAGFDRLQNGHLFYLTTDFRAVEIDMLGNKVREWYAARRPQGSVEGAVPVDVQTIHHQPHELPWGNFLVMTAYAKEIDDFYTSETDPDAPRRKTKVMGDDIVEFNRDGSIVWNWNSFEHLDPHRIGYHVLSPYWHVRGFPDHADWTHGNGLCYDERDDAVLICMRNQDAIIKVDRKTGEIRWILGDHHGWPDRLNDKLLKPEGKVRWPYHMHNPKVTPTGTILLWNNNIFQSLPFDGRPKVPPHETCSRAVEYAVDEDKMTVSELWVSEEGPSSDTCSNFAMGDVHWLPQTDNILVFYGVCMARRDDMTWGPMDIRSIGEFPMWTRVREFTHTNPAEIVFEVHIEDLEEIFTWATFGGMKIPSLYPSKG